MKTERTQRRSLCPITSSDQIRADALKATSRIQGNFPAGLAQPALRALLSANVSTLEELARLELKQLQQLHGMGPKAIATLTAALAAKGLSLRM